MNAVSDIITKLHNNPNLKKSAAARAADNSPKPPTPTQATANGAGNAGAARPGPLFAHGLGVTSPTAPARRPQVPPLDPSVSPKVFALGQDWEVPQEMHGLLPTPLHQTRRRGSDQSPTLARSPNAGPRAKGRRRASAQQL